MALPNLNQRRDKVKSLMASGFSDKEIKRECSLEFGCSASAIDSDIRLFRGNSYHQVRREIIGTRDGYVCQYCGIYEPNGIIEHVISRSMGGHDKRYNMVWACWSCNVLKKMTVWVPANLDKITKSNLKWRAKVIEMAKNN